MVSLANHWNRLPLDEKAWWEEMEMLEISAYCKVAVVHFTDQNWIPKTVYCISCMMACKIGFSKWNADFFFFFRESMAVICYIKLFRTGADRHNGILMSLILLVTETIMIKVKMQLEKDHILFIVNLYY